MPRAKAGYPTGTQMSSKRKSAVSAEQAPDTTKGSFEPSGLI
ncbi:hypothetical protein VIBNIFTn2_1240003 [Vibrio nigripulchritudo FTn2]|nr:hypothetical protein VIBNIFTn2_1240003 [Vibrio nigripulchritudo FTn2]